MPADDIQAQTADGVSHVFPAGTPNEVIDGAIKRYVTIQGAPKAAASAAGITNPGVAPQPLAGKMKSEGAAYEAGMDPQDRYLSQHPEDRGRVEAGSSMAIPMAAMTLGTTSPVATIAEKGVGGYLAPLARAALKSFAGSEAGQYLGRKIGPTAATIGGYAGALAGPFVSGETFAKLPFGVGRMAATDEEIASADAKAAVARRNARVAAGLEEAPPSAPAPAAKQEPTRPAAPAPPPLNLRAGEPAAPPSAAGQTDFTGLRTSREQGIIQPREPGRTVGDRLLPAAPAAPTPPAPRLNAFGEPIPEVGKTATFKTGGLSPDAAPTPLTDEQIRDTRAQVADLRRQARDANAKQATARAWPTQLRHIEREKALLDRADQLEQNLGIGKSAPTVAAAPEASLNATYESAPPELKQKIDELASQYKTLESFEKSRFESDYGFARGDRSGLPLKEKLARSLSEQAAEPEPEFLSDQEEIGHTAEREPGDEPVGTGPTISTAKEANAAPGPQPTPKQQVGKIVDTALDVKPLNPKVSLREQIGKTVDVPANPKTELEAKYPDKAVRQMVHVQGEKMVQAIGDDKELMRAVHDLTKVDLSRAAENGGLDLGQKSITSSKFAGEGGITRQEVFNQLLDKGHTPREIVELAKKEPASK